MPDHEQPQIIDQVPGMEHVQPQEPSRGPVNIENPSPQTMRTAIGTPYEHAGAGVMVSNETAPTAVPEVVELAGAAAASGLMEVPQSVIDSNNARAEARQAEADARHADTVNVANQLAQQGQAAGINVESPYDGQGNLKSTPVSNASSQAGLQAIIDGANRR